MHGDGQRQYGGHTLGDLQQLAFFRILLKRKLMRYIRHYNTRARPVKWKYADVRRRITPTLPVTGH